MCYRLPYICTLYYRVYRVKNFKIHNSIVALHWKVTNYVNMKLLIYFMKNSFCLWVWFFRIDFKLSDHIVAYTSIKSISILTVSYCLTLKPKIYIANYIMALRIVKLILTMLPQTRLCAYRNMYTWVQMKL